MASNLIGLNLATRAGEGGADVMTWEKSDATAKRLYAEQKQKEEQGYKEYQLGQQELAKDFSKVRSADIPDLMDRYNVLKQKKQKLLFDPKIKNDAIAFAEAQKEANLAEAELRNLMAESVEVKELDNQITKRLSTNRDEFDDEKVPTLFEAFKMPTSQRKEKNLIGAEPFRYTGMDMKGLADLSKKSMGTIQKVPFGQEVETDGGYNFEQKFIGRTNDPVQYATNMYKGMQTNKYTQGARAALSQMSPIQINQIQSAYNAIPDAEFEAKWGRKKEDLLKAFSANPDDKVGQYVTLDAMQYAVNNMPKEVEIKRRKNDKFVEQNKNTEWDRRNEKASAQADRRNAVRAANSVNNQYRPDIHVNSIYDSGVDDNMTYNYKGQKINGREVALPEELEDKYYDKFKGELQRPNKVIMTKDKKKVYLFYYSPKKTASGNHIIDPSRTRAVDVQAAIIPTLSKSFGGTAFTKTTLFTQEGNNKPQQGNGQKSGRKYKGLDKNGNPIFE